MSVRLSGRSGMTFPNCGRPVVILSILSSRVGAQQLPWGHADRDHGTWVVFRISATRTCHGPCHPRIRRSGHRAGVRAGGPRPGRGEIDHRTAARSRGRPGHLVVHRPRAYLGRPAMEQRGQTAAAGSSRQRRRRGQVQRFHRHVAVGRRPHHRYRRLCALAHRLGADHRTPRRVDRRRAHPRRTGRRHAGPALLRRARPR